MIRWRERGDWELEKAEVCKQELRFKNKRKLGGGDRIVMDRADVDFAVPTSICGTRAVVTKP